MESPEQQTAHTICSLLWNELSEFVSVVSLLMGIMIIIAMIEMEIIVSEDNAIISGFPRHLSIRGESE